VVRRHRAGEQHPVLDHDTQVAEAVGLQRVEVLEDVLLALIAGRLARQGDWERALQVAETIPEGDDKTSALDDLATAYIDAGRYPEALQTVQRIKPPDSRAWALVWALIRMSRQRRDGSPGSRPLPSVPALLRLIARRHPR
jgi:Flp pilus assembly protein TadD